MRHGGRVISQETDFVVNMRRSNYRWGALIAIVIWSVLAGVGLMAGWSATTHEAVAGVFGLIAFLCYFVSLRTGPTIVTEDGIEYDAGPFRRFDPWHRLMWGWEDQSGITLRRVHGIEAALGVLDNRKRSVTLVVVPFDIPDYARVRDHIQRALHDAHASQGTRWVWEGPHRYR
jgi:hypothetical protein